MIDLRQLERQALAMQRLLVVLLDRSETPAELPLLDQPVHWAAHLKHWSEVYGRAGDSLTPILGGYTAVLNAVWESRGGWCGARSYTAVETWLREKTLTAGVYCPRMTLRTLVFTTAAHNWLWWRRRAEPAKAEPWADGTVGGTREELLKRDVDPFLDLLEKADQPPDDGPRLRAGADGRPAEAPRPPEAKDGLSLGDLLAFHLMAVRLGQLAPAVSRPLTREEKSRLERLQSLSPVSRLAAVGTEERPLLTRRREGPWVGIERLLIDPAAAGVRQYLASSLGRHALGRDPKTAPVGEVLALLEMLHRLADAGPVRETFRRGVRTFLAQTLRATFTEWTPEALQAVWQVWSWGDPPQLSLAEWCGRLARWCEADVPSRQSGEALEVDWLWRELAQAALPRWLSGDGDGLVCWGLWLRGYLEGADEAYQVPRLTLAHNACRRSIEQLVSSWDIAVARKLGQRVGRQVGHGTAERLRVLQASLQERPVYRQLLPDWITLEEATRPRVAAAAGAPAPAEPLPENPNVTAYCSTTTTSKGPRHG